MLIIISLLSCCKAFLSFGIREKWNSSLRSSPQVWFSNTGLRQADTGEKKKNILKSWAKSETSIRCLYRPSSQGSPELPTWWTNDPSSGLTRILPTLYCKKWHLFNCICEQAPLIPPLSMAVSLCLAKYRAHSKSSIFAEWLTCHVLLRVWFPANN